MPINDSEAKFYARLANKSSSAPQKALKDTSLAETRANIESAFKLANPANMLNYQDHLIPVRDGNEIPIRIYNYDAPSNSPVLFYFMGNGYIFDLLNINSLICSRISKYCSAKVILINTRLAPENPLPTPIFDGLDTIHHIKNQATQYAINPDKMVIAGYCTGATCAVAITDLGHKMDLFKINKLILLNGIYDLTLNNTQYVDYENEDISFSKEMLEYIIKQQNISELSKNTILYSPIFMENFSHFPETILIVAEYDRNRSSSEAFYQKLSKTGLNIKKIVLPGQTHNTIIFHPQMKGSLDPAKMIADFINPV